MNRQRLSVSKAKAKRRPKVGMSEDVAGGRQTLEPMALYYDP